MKILGGIVSLYTFLIFIRVVLTWFPGANYGRAAGFLSSVTDPYLNWFRRFRFLRVANLDLSPVAGIAALSLANTVFFTLARFGRITVGIILSMIMYVIGSTLAFILNVLIVILALRLAAYLTNRDVYHGFWRVIDQISAPVLYRINRIVFGRRLVRYMTGILVSLGVLLFFRIGLAFLATLGQKLLARLP
jgi:YggT family protein